MGQKKDHPTLVRLTGWLFFWFDSIAMINVPKEIIKISVSNTVVSITPFLKNI
nr:hypothetical protein [Lentibacillus jeotgali]